MSVASSWCDEQWLHRAGFGSLAEQWCHICSLFTPEDLEPALKRAEPKPHITRHVAHGWLWPRAQFSPSLKNTQRGGGLPVLGLTLLSTSLLGMAPSSLHLLA